MVEWEDGEGWRTDKGNCPSSGGHEDNTPDTCPTLVILNWIGMQSKVAHRSVYWSAGPGPDKTLPVLYCITQW